MYVLLHAEPSGLNGGGNQLCPPPKFSAGNWQTPCPPPPPLQQPPQMPAADFLLPVCCCPPISCGVPCTLQHSCSYQRPPPEYFCHQTQPPPNACSRCSAASLLLPSNFLWCTLHRAAQLQLPTPAPLMVVPPPQFSAASSLLRNGKLPAPPPHPCSRLYANFAFSDHSPPKCLQQIFCCQFVAALQFLVVYLAPRSTVAACPPLPPSWRCPPPHPPSNFLLQTPEGASSRFSAASSLLLRPAHVPTQKTSSSKFVTVLVSVVGVADAQAQGKRCLTQSPAPFGCDRRGAAVWQFSPLPI